MKAFLQTLRQVASRKLATAVTPSLYLVVIFGASASARAADAAQTFPTPENAAAALGTAVENEDPDALRSLFGPAITEIENPDRVQAAQEFASFGAALRQKHRLVRQSDTKFVLEIGADNWPFPIPIVRREEGWTFDTAAGQEELLNRRIGRNELAVVQAMRAYVNAQREYASRDRDNDEVLEYAQRLASSPGMKDGLYWPPDLDGEISPLGPFVAQAHREGYSRKLEPSAPEPFHGYYFKLLTRQGPHAPGRKYNYVINGNMIGGFAMVAWPAEYGTSGIMTFIVNQQGQVYQRDLDKSGTVAAAKMKAYDPDPRWHVCPD